MKRPNISYIHRFLTNDKFISFAILIVGFGFVGLSGNLRQRIFLGSDGVNASKEIVENQKTSSTPNSVQKSDNVSSCYECGSGDVLGTQIGNCGGKLAKSSDLICTATGFTETADSDDGKIGSIVTVPRLCELRIFEITYPVYWNGHNKYVNGSYDNRYDLSTGEWPSASGYVYGGTVASVNKGKPTTAGNNYASIYEPPNVRASGSSDGSSRSGLKYTLELGGNVHDKEHAGEYQEFYTPDCSESAPGKTLIGEKGCVSQDWSINTIHKGVLDGNDPLLLSHQELEELLYPEVHPDCSSFSHLTKVIEDKDKACINLNGFDGWSGIWDIFVKITKGCLLDGSCWGSTKGTVTLVMDHISFAGRFITIDSRTVPGEESELRYVSTPCKVKKICLGGTEILEATCVWPDYLYQTWLSSEYGSSICDPSKNFASVISENGDLVTFNFCEYDGGLGYFDYMQYVTKRCDCVVEGGCEAISGDELSSCKMMIDGSL